MNNFYEARSITDSIVIVTNLFILIFLKYKLAKFKTGDMSAAICSIYTQFFLFLLSFTIITTVDFFFGFSAATESPDFTLMHVVIFINETIPLVPILYVLYVHRQTFKREVRRNSSRLSNPRLNSTQAIPEPVDIEANSNKLSSEVASSKPPSITGAFRKNRLMETGPTAKTSSNHFSSPAVTVRTESCTLNSD